LLFILYVFLSELDNYWLISVNHITQHRVIMQQHKLTTGEVINRLKNLFLVDTDYKLAKEMGIGQANISMWKKRDKVSIKVITDICNQHGFNINHVLYGEGHSQVPGSFGMPKQTGLIPVVGLAEAGPGIFSLDGDYPPGSSDTYLSKPYGLKDTSAFGIRIEGDSMRPAFKPGHMVIVSPNLECQNGDIVVAHLKSNGNILGELYLKSTMVTLIKYNDDDIYVPRSELRWCYPVIWHKRR